MFVKIPSNYPYVIKQIASMQILDVEDQHCHVKFEIDVFRRVSYKATVQNSRIISQTADYRWSGRIIRHVKVAKEQCVAKNILHPACYCIS